MPPYLSTAAKTGYEGAHLLLTDIGHECVDLIAFFNEPCEDARCVYGEIGSVDHFVLTIFCSELTETARVGEQYASFSFVRGRHSAQGEGGVKLKRRPIPAFSEFGRPSAGPE